MIWQNEKQQITQKVNRQILETQRKGDFITNIGYGTVLVNLTILGIINMLAKEEWIKPWLLYAFVVNGLLSVAVHAVVSVITTKKIEDLKKTLAGVNELLGGERNV